MLYCLHCPTLNKDFLLLLFLTNIFFKENRDLKMPSTKWHPSWWRHQMETFSALLALCVGNSLVTGEFPAQRQWRGALVFSLICVWTNGWVNNKDAGDLRRCRVTVMILLRPPCLHQLDIMSCLGWYFDLTAVGLSQWSETIYFPPVPTGHRCCPSPSRCTVRRQVLCGEGLNHGSLRRTVTWLWSGQTLKAA